MLLNEFKGVKYNLEKLMALFTAFLKSLFTLAHPVYIVLLNTKKN